MTPVFQQGCVRYQKFRTSMLNLTTFRRCPWALLHRWLQQSCINMLIWFCMFCCSAEFGHMLFRMSLFKSHVFTARSSCASAVLGIRILSVFPSVYLSITHVLWCSERTYCQHFDTTWKGNHSSFRIPIDVGGRCPLPPEICTQSDPRPLENAEFDRFLLIMSQP